MNLSALSSFVAGQNIYDLDTEGAKFTQWGFSYGHLDLSILYGNVNPRLYCPLCDNHSFNLNRNRGFVYASQKISPSLGAHAR